MPIVAFNCPRCYKQIDLDEAAKHFDACQYMPAPLVSALIESTREDLRHTGLNITTTAGTDCPRRLILQRTRDYATDPKTRLAAAFGKTLHNWLAQHNDEVWVTERCTCSGKHNPSAPVCGKNRCTFHGTIEGIELSGVVDAIARNNDDTYTVLDWKFENALRVLYDKPDGTPKDTHIIQAGINNELARQNDIVIDTMIFVRIPWNQLDIVVMSPPPTLEQALAERPMGGAYSAQEIYRMLASAKELIDNGSSVNDAVRTLPMVGETMARNKRGTACLCSKWCDVNDTCHAIGTT